MVKRTGPTNYQLQLLVQELQPKTLNSRFWKRVVEEIVRPSRQRRIVNMYKIDKYAREGETILVPGKVLSVGELNKKVEVAAISFSAEAKQKILSAKGKTLTIHELLHKNPEGKGVRILG
ncbi:50S ribosomal protein L18e [Candidatus Woesearchaeota archaeon]|nr:50S ribosomal protein L18e [Candidatus Woesearchaeota archaeon]